LWEAHATFGTKQMPAFPDAQRLELVNSPLELVVCQLRFPMVLALAGGQPPEEFGRRVQGTYPVAKKKQTVNFEIVGESAVQKSSVTWVFEDQDSEWTVSLASNFVALEAKKYVRFADFLERFEQVLQITREAFQVQLMERLGLRYVDHLSRTLQPRLPENWTSQINGAILPARPMRAEGEAQTANLETRFAMGDSLLAIRSVFVEKDFPGVTEDELILDFDCYSEKRRNLDGVRAELERFRTESYKAFRWAIGDLIQYFEVRT
jgi:uncharacterized protein (TIGR04255 family)